MQKKSIGLYVFLIISFMFLIVVISCTESSHTIHITGAVEKSLTLNMKNLQALQSVTVRLNEVTMDEEFNGVFYFRGIPLKDLLERAGIQKGETAFKKPIDLAIIVRNKAGQKAVLSWGELFYRNPADVVLAFSAAPQIPHHKCSRCHEPEVYQERLDKLSRPIGYPKLVVANDFYTDRCIENVTSIEVLDLRLNMETKKIKNLFSPRFIVSGDVKQPATITDLTPYQRVETLAKIVGDGIGYHGIASYGGILFSDLLTKTGVRPDVTQGFVISAPDGYRTLLSSGEIFFSSHGANILIADTMNNELLKKSGKFKLLLADDLAADRWIKAVEKIEVITFK